MTKKFTHAVLTSCLIVTVLMYNAVSAQNCTAPAVGCSNTDFSNSFLKSSNPNTLEYDNMVSTFHSTMARQADGRVLVWGEYLDKNGIDHVYAPRELNSINYPITGSVLRFAAGSRDQTHVQYCVLTTDGLYVWGLPDMLVPGVIKSTKAIGLINLPAGVLPGDVKMIFGTYRTLAIVTCNGAVWVISSVGLKNGDGTNDLTVQQANWHQVKTNQPGNPVLSNVVAVRGSAFSLMALKSDGTVWTWGERCYLGAGGNMETVTYATPMQNLPGTPKMIGMTQSYGRRENAAIDNHTVTYYILTTAGRVYALGSNRSKELGAFLDQTTVPDQKNWVQVQKSATAGDYLTNVAWISPQEHDGYYAAINALTSDGIVYSWGTNALDMLGLGSTFFNNPTAGPAGTSASDKIMAVESGGHTSILVKQCTGNYGYVGHKVNGSMGDGTSTSSTVSSYSFSTAVLDLCSAPALATILNATNSNACPGTPFNLRANNDGGSFSILSGNASVNSSTGVISAITGVGPITARYSISSGSCPSNADIIIQQRDFGNLNPSVWPVASATTAATNQVWLGTNFPTVDCQTNVSDAADGLQIYKGSSPVSGTGTSANPFIISGLQTYNFRVTVNGSGIAKPVYWAVWYDVNGDGKFTDAQDLFQTGNTTHGSPVTTNFNVIIPVTGTAAGAGTGTVRVMATVQNTSFTKAMNGTAVLTNGEVEDFYVKYTFPLPVALTNFSTLKQGNKTLIQWSSVSEQNNKGFDVLRSSDANNWTSLAFINSKASNGNSDQKTDYSFLDHAPNNGINYYRLKQTDFDGKYEYSNIKQVAFNTDNTIHIFPNPARETITISGLAGNETIRMVDMTGRVTKTFKAVEGNNILFLGGVTSGMYYLNVITVDGKVFTEKIIKTK